VTISRVSTAIAPALVRSPATVIRVGQVIRVIRTSTSALGNRACMGLVSTALVRSPVTATQVGKVTRVIRTSTSARGPRACMGLAPTALVHFPATVTQVGKVTRAVLTLTSVMVSLVPGMELAPNLTLAPSLLESIHVPVIVMRIIRFLVLIVNAIPNQNVITVQTRIVVT